MLAQSTATESAYVASHQITHQMTASQDTSSHCVPCRFAEMDQIQTPGKQFAKARFGRIFQMWTCHC